MKQLIRRILCLVLAMAMVCTVLPGSVLAQEGSPELPGRIRTAQTEVHHNPLYEGIVDDSMLQLPEIELPQAGTSATDGAVYVSEAEAAAQLRQAMVNRQGTCVLYIATTNSNHNPLMESLFQEAISHTGDPVEGDYLAWQYGSWKAGSSYFQEGDTYCYTSTFTLTYYTDAEQEALMDTEVEKLLAELDLAEGTEYEKIEGIYDYICANVTYDYANVNDRTHLLKHTAYAALINGTCVCQGYAVLLYRLALTLGLDCRLIAGYGGGEAHGWNIVRLDDLYYNLDSTWDAGKSTYSYFLVSEDNFGGHVRGNMNGINYAGEAFYAAYPMSEENYSPEPTATGTCGENLTWVLRGSTLTIEGTGAMTDFTSTGQPWREYKQQIRRVKIADGATSVGDYAFFHCYDLEYVELPDSVQTIGASSFFYCNSLESIDLPGNLVTIRDHAFGSCDVLTGVTFPAGLTTIGITAFSGTALTSAVLPEGVTSIGRQAFMGCPLTEAVIPASLTEIGFCAFQDCTPLAAVSVDPENSAYCNDRQGALYSKNMSTLILVPAGYIGSFVIPDSVVTVESCALRNCDLLTAVQIPDSVTDLGEMAFYECALLNNVVIPESVTRIPDSAFAWCPGLSNILLPETLTAIGESAYYGCTDLKLLVIPGSVAELGARCFGNSGLQTVFFRGDAPSFTESSAFRGVTAEAWYPGDNATWTEEIRQNYEGTITWKAAKQYSVLPESVTELDARSEPAVIRTEAALTDFVAAYVDGALVDSGKYTLTEGSTVVTFHADFLDSLPMGIHSFLLQFTDGYTYGTIRINADHVHNYYYHTELKLPTCTESGYTTYTCTCGDSYDADHTEPLGHSYSDGSCTRCGEADPDALNPGETATSGSCGEHVYWRFDAATGTLSIFGSGTMADYEGQAYLPWASYLQRITSVIVESGVTSIGNAACVGMQKLERVTLPEGITSIGNSSFAMTGSLKQIALPQSLEHIGVQAFDSSGLTVITIPAGVKTMDQMVFFFCADLTQITFLGDAPALPGGGVFIGVSATAYYPGDNATWTEETRAAFGGDINWVAGSSPAPELNGVVRIYGRDRIETSLAIAAQMKETLNVSKFGSIIVASALNFPDALTGSYLAAVKNAPILLTYDAVQSRIVQYIADNLAPGGTVYLLGGEAVVPESFARDLESKGVAPKRLAGTDRFGTNLAILKEAGVDGSQQVLICTAAGFADSLSASAAGLPIVLVHGSLTQAQKEFLVGTSGRFVIIGGESAVSAKLEAELRALGSVERLSGAGRYQTSVMVARKLIQAPEAAVLAYARNYPDGLCGGPLAYALGAPLILTDDVYCSEADAYVEGISSGVVVGGINLIGDNTVRTIFDLAIGDPIPVK